MIKRRVVGATGTGDSNAGSVAPSIDARTTSPLRRARALALGFLASALVVTLGSSWWVAAVLPRVPDQPRSAASGRSSTDAAFVHEAFPAVDARRPGEAAIVLTGGPVPGWTDRVLDLFEESGIHATFFFEGAEAARHPDLVRRAQGDGHTIGLTGLSGEDLVHDTIDGARERTRLANTMLSGITGELTRLVRPMGLATPEVADEEESAISTAIGESMTVVVADRSSRPPTADTTASDLVLDAQPPAGPGAVVEFPRPADGRSAEAGQSVDSIALITAFLRMHEWHLVTIDAFADTEILPATSEPAEPGTKWTGALLVLLSGIGNRTLGALYAGSGALGLLTILLSAATLLGVRRFHRSRGVVDLRDSTRDVPTPAVTVVIPCRDERGMLLRALRSLENASRTLPEVIIVDDGSTDGTAELAEQFGRLPMTVLRTEPSGKSNALNVGLAAATNEVIVTIDADTRLEPGALDLIAHPMRDPSVGAVSGSIRVEEGGGLLRRFQSVEYAMANGVHRMAQAAIGTQICVPGAFGAFRRTALREIGGFSDRTVAEDTDATIAIQHAGWAIHHEPAAVAHTLPPLSLTQLWRQRMRWSGGVLQVLALQAKHFRQGQSPERRTLTAATLMLHAAVLAVFSLPADLLLLCGLLLGVGSLSHPLVYGALLCQFSLLCVGLVSDKGDRRLILLAPAYWLFYRPVLYLVTVRGALTLALGDQLRWLPRREAPASRPNSVQLNGAGPVPGPGPEHEHGPEHEQPGSNTQVPVRTSA